jgi:Uncharacterized conserved protein (DUF2293)
VAIPAGWEFLPPGDAFVTRTVKAAGTYWVAWQPRSRHRAHRRLLGLWAPVATIAAARERAAETEATRAVRRQASRKQRGRTEERYRAELAAAVLDYLRFAPAYAELAEQVAREAAEQAAVVGSGRVGRTSTRPIEERAELAARAHIRHRYTDYHRRLEAAVAQDLGVDDYEYAAIKRSTHDAVDDFLRRHRTP